MATPMAEVTGGIVPLGIAIPVMEAAPCIQPWDSATLHVDEAQYVSPPGAALMEA